MSFNFSEALEQSLTEQDGAKKQVPPGMYNAIFQGVAKKLPNPKTPESKATAWAFTYLVTEGEHTGATVEERIYITKRDGSPVPYSLSRIIKRVQSAGFSAEQIKGFKNPKTDKDLGDFIKLVGRPVMLTVETETYMDSNGVARSKPAVKRVEPNSGALAAQKAA